MNEDKLRYVLARMHNQSSITRRCAAEVARRTHPFYGDPTETVDDWDPLCQDVAVLSRAATEIEECLADLAAIRAEWETKCKPTN